MRIFCLFLNIIIISARLFWRLYENSDFDLMYNETPTKEATSFSKDANICKANPADCTLLNEEISYSEGNFENKCCYISTSPEYNRNTFVGCLAVFTGKYFESNLYSLALYEDSDIYYQCDFGKSYKKYVSSSYIPYQTWEIILKEKYDCIYSKTEKECKASPKSFTQNIKCVWFSYDNISPRTQCYGVQDLTDYEFKRLIPYFTLDSLYLENKTLNFSCYGKSDKVIKGIFDLKYNYIKMENFTYEKKISIEIGSEEVLHIFSKKQTFVGIKDYKIVSPYDHRIFLYTSSPLEYNNKFFSIITKFGEENDGEYIEQIVQCIPNSIINNGNFKIILSECQVSNLFKKIENIKIEKGIDLIGNFEEKKIFEGMQFFNVSEEKKIRENSSIFTFSSPTAHINENYLIGNTTLDRKNVTFYFYYSKDSKVQTVQAKGSFLKDNLEVSFEMSPLINLKEGNSFIPDQVCQAENGEYLYIKNKLGIIYPKFNNEEYNYDNINYDAKNNPTTPTTTPTTNNNRNDDITNNYNYRTNNININSDNEATDNSEESEKINETWIRFDRGERLFTRGFSIVLITTLLWYI